MKANVNHENGYLLIELMVSAVILLIGLSATATMLQSLVHATSSGRSFSKISAHTNSVIGALKDQGYITTLKMIGSQPGQITNGQSATLSSAQLTTLVPSAVADATAARATFQVKLTAQRNILELIPGSLVVRVSITHRRGVFNSATYVYETVLARVAQ